MFKRQMRPRKVVMRVLFGHRDQPSVAKLRKAVFGPKVVARVRQDPRTGRAVVTVTTGQRGKDRADRRAQDRQKRAPVKKEDRTRRKKDGTYNGSGKVPTRWPVGETRLRCDYCRGTGTRPVYSGTGQIKTITGMEPCNHRGAGRTAAGAGDVFVCPTCANTGIVRGRQVRRDRTASSFQEPCPTCQGWHTNAHLTPTFKPASPQRRTQR